MKRVAFVCLVFTCIFTTSAIAQTPPPGSEAGSQAERFKQESKLLEKNLQAKKKKPPLITVEKEEKKPAAKESISFLLKEINITGCTIFKPGSFTPIYKSYIGKTITFNDLEDIAAKIN